ncbi:helix-turn-helix domain-containing protein [Aureimonas sp. N4]|uniref:helix-turn-helix domain-containing protein n=1 Tax=Aureimonas sp. N4 TaxID=1638165 RepID=UPI0007855E58|nr:helix-turn-helix domain-containing protein [Aureimonas sp. N4]
MPARFSRLSSAARLRALRDAAGQSLDDVERGTRLHVALLRTLEHGRPITQAQAAVLARHFSVPTAEIVNG